MRWLLHLTETLVCGHRHHTQTALLLSSHVTEWRLCWLCNFSLVEQSCLTISICYGIIFVVDMPNDRILSADLWMPVISMLMCYITCAGTRMTNNQAHTTKCRANKLACTQKHRKMVSRSSQAVAVRSQDILPNVPSMRRYWAPVLSRGPLDLNSHGRTAFACIIMWTRKRAGDLQCRMLADLEHLQNAQLWVIVFLSPRWHHVTCVLIHRHLQHWRFTVVM